MSKETVVTMQHSYSGPLPPAQEFKSYGETLSNAPDRILALAENEQRERIEYDKREANRAFAMNVIGMIVGCIIVVMLIVFAYLLGMEGHDWLAGGLMTSATALAIIFVLRKLPNR